MGHVAISSVKTDVEIGLSVLRKRQKQYYLASQVVTTETSRERDRVSRSVTDGRSDGRSVGRTVGRTAGAKVANYIVMGDLRLQLYSYCT